ncbi:MAG: DUF3853 family protein [Bacteroidota bacterium]
MNHENKIYAIHQIATLLGISVSSIDRWVDAGKLKCLVTKDGTKHFTIDQLLEFATTYNISMQFLVETTHHSKPKSEQIFEQISAAQ